MSQLTALIGVVVYTSFMIFLIVKFIREEREE